MLSSISTSQATDAGRLKRKLNIGDTRIVAIPDIAGDLTCDITFDHYEFSGAKIMRDREKGVDCHVYFGKRIKSELFRERTRGVIASTNISLTSMVTSSNGRFSVRIDRSGRSLCVGLNNVAKHE